MEIALSVAAPRALTKQVTVSGKATRWIEHS